MLTFLMPAKPNLTPCNRDLLECDTLRLLCCPSVKAGTRLEICRLLQPEDFRDPFRRALFEEIVAAGNINARRLRALLPSRLSSRGFSAAELDRLCPQKSVTAPEMEQLFQSALYLLKLEGANHPGPFSSEADVPE
ncbi:MAG TPA: hypothetical protein VJN93_13540 [Candidatus Acidoferrum sp.]|nr:hypothetical protein [Candidatus Acidoferrum sp.]